MPGRADRVSDEIQSRLNLQLQKEKQLMRALSVCLLQLAVASLLSAAKIEVENASWIADPCPDPRRGKPPWAADCERRKKRRTVHPEICGRPITTAADFMTGEKPVFPLKPGAKRVISLPKPEQFGVRFIKALLPATSAEPFQSASAIVT